MCPESCGAGMARAGAAVVLVLSARRNKHSAGSGSCGKVELVARRSVLESHGRWHSNARQCWQSLGMDGLSSAHRWCLGIKDLLPKTLAEWDKAFREPNSDGSAPLCPLVAQEPGEQHGAGIWGCSVPGRYCCQPWDMHKEGWLL